MASILDPEMTRRKFLKHTAQAAGTLAATSVPGSGVVADAVSEVGKLTESARALSLLPSNLRKGVEDILNMGRLYRRRDKVVYRLPREYENTKYLDELGLKTGNGKVEERIADLSDEEYEATRKRFKRYVSDHDYEFSYRSEHDVGDQRLRPVADAPRVLPPNPHRILEYDFSDLNVEAVKPLDDVSDLILSKPGGKFLYSDLMDNLRTIQASDFRDSWAREDIQGSLRTNWRNRAIRERGISFLDEADYKKRAPLVEMIFDKRGNRTIPYDMLKGEVLPEFFPAVGRMVKDMMERPEKYKDLLESGEIHPDDYQRIAIEKDPTPPTPEPDRSVSGRLEKIAEARAERKTRVRPRTSPSTMMGIGLGVTGTAAYLTEAAARGGPKEVAKAAAIEAAGGATIGGAFKAIQHYAPKAAATIGRGAAKVIGPAGVPLTLVEMARATRALGGWAGGYEATEEGVRLKRNKVSDRYLRSHKLTEPFLEK